MYPARLLGTSWKREHWHCRLWRVGAGGGGGGMSKDFSDSNVLQDIWCTRRLVSLTVSASTAQHSTAPPTGNLYEKHGLILCDLWFVLPYCPTLRPTSVRVLLTIITYGPIREYRRCFQFVDIHITVKHENERIKAAEPQQENKSAVHSWD
jgi:hypothetical protein